MNQDNQLNREEPQDCSSNALVLLVYGELPETERGPLQEHLGQCVQCRQELEALQGALAGLENHLTTPAMSQAAIAETRQRAHQALWPRRQAQVQHGAKRLTRWLAYAAAAVLAMVAGWQLLAPQPLVEVENNTGGTIVQRPTNGAEEAGALELASQTERDLLETALMGEMLLESYTADDWSEAANVVLAQANQDELLRELMMLQMELEWLEQQAD